MFLNRLQKNPKRMEALLEDLAKLLGDENQKSKAIDMIVDAAGNEKELVGQWTASSIALSADLEKGRMIPLTEQELISRYGAVNAARVMEESVVWYQNFGHRNRRNISNSKIQKYISERINPISFRNIRNTHNPNITAIADPSFSITHPRVARFVAQGKYRGAAEECSSVSLAPGSRASALSPP